eukprot:CAMPEP_0181034792 /NCGR_PEP_ID=MMETSP1070-20121207/7992_1 /TAXON_ID=265543 /ORGANISM="Minutocellus polymorphus, Strain NH13" /LENGTH=410 /DNA_ID=CAMNT_0023112335 /DNA_START=91 /DNA_END=1323 /DNA_ORIENTATION=-
MTSASSSTTLPLVCVLIIICSILTQPAHGFAAWLAEGAKCWTDLDPSEVIMNANVVPYEKSSYPNIALHVYSANDASTMIEPIRRIDDDQMIIYEQDGPRAEYILKLHIPPDDLQKSGALGDLQYVMDVSLSSPATFAGGNTGCDNRRAHGRRTDVVHIKIDLDGEAADEVDAGDEVKVWAGWATGHEAVQLTDAVVFKRQRKGVDEKSADNANESNKDTVEVPEDTGRMAAAAAFDDYEGGGKSKSLSEGERRANAKEHAKHRLEDMRTSVHHVDGGHDHQRVVDDQMGQKKRKRKGGGGDDGDDDDGGDGAAATAKKQRPKTRDPPKTQTQNQKKKKYVPSGPRPAEDSDESTFGAFRRRYHKHELGLQQFSMKGYFAGCGLLATIVLFLARYSELAGKRLHKGSRTL